MFRAETVLLVEDEDALRGLAVTIPGDGYAVLEASPARSGAGLWDFGAIDALVTDVVMPGMSGPGCRRRFNRGGHT